MYHPGMTLGEATQLLDPNNRWACACCGPPRGENLCYCQLAVRDAGQLKRGAHIVAKLLADAADN